ncbi:MAG: peptidoglycan-binding protein [Christensenellales bacterium]
MTRFAKHRLFCLMLSVVLAAQGVAFAKESYPYVSFATASVRLRARPSSSATILDVVQSGEAVLVTGTDGRYKAVEYEGKKGFIMASFLSETGQDALPTPKPVSAELSAQYPSLTTGATGDSVKVLQVALKELGFYNGSIDSSYGSGTAQAVRDFQEGNRLPVNGTADPVSQQLLFEGSPRNSRGNKTRVKTLPLVEGLTIHPGDQGIAVETLQRRLKELQLYKGAVDGKYGNLTQAAVRAFQKANNLKQDGIVGKATQAKLYVTVEAPPTQAPAPTTTPSPEFVPSQPDSEEEATYPYQTTTSSAVNLRKGASLSSMRYLTIPQGAAIEVLSDEGKYQKVIYRSFTGYVMTEYVNIPEAYLSGKALKDDPSAKINYETLTVGADGAKVRALQQALTELGFYSDAIDGKFGAGTLSALKAFQTKNNLRATGIALPELQKMLYEGRVRNSKNKRVLVNTLPPIDGYPMQLGDYGDAVYALHQALSSLGHYDGPIGYEYTKSTATAVRDYQKAHSIKQTGKVDSFTILSLKTHLATPAPNQPQDTALSADTVVEIRSGTRGQPVTRLQERLVDLGYYSIVPDGIYDSNDIAALRQFQRNNGLTVTGIADLGTQQVLYSVYAVNEGGQVPSPGVLPTLAPSLLKMGMGGEAVQAMQSRLIALGYLQGNADGIFGTQTAKALSNFQRANNLSADGIAGSQTLTALYGANAIANAPAATPTPSPESITGNLKLGATGSEVTALQQRLISLNYLTGVADGIFGPRTAMALQDFQQKNNLVMDGIAGKLTLAKLNSATAISASGVVQPQPTPQPTTSPIVETASNFQAPKASEVRFANWYTEVRNHAQRLRNVVIYDFMTGKHYNFRFFSFGKHADGDTPTKEDTAVMNSILGENNWTPRPVWVVFSDGRVYMGSTHSHGHEVDYTKDNDLSGHLCVHFPRDIAEAALTGPYAVSHQNAILAGWDVTQGMAR